MKVLISEKLSPHKVKTPEGYLICTDAILARTGKQTYYKSELYGDSCDDPAKIIELDRPESEVFADKTLYSFENKPLTVEHPDEDVNVENYDTFSVGFVRDVKKSIIDGKPVMTATLVVTNKDAIDDIESGKYKELSCGYDCDIDESDGEFRQINIRGNHVALCEHGRAGNARIIDSIKDEKDAVKGIVFSSKDNINAHYNLNFDIDGFYKLGYQIYVYIFHRGAHGSVLVDIENKYQINVIGSFTVNETNDGILVGDLRHFDRPISVKLINEAVRYFNSHVFADEEKKFMKKYAEDKNGRRFVLEEVSNGIKASNESGRIKMFRSWKEAEEEFGKRGIVIFDSKFDDSFYACDSFNIGDAINLKPTREEGVDKIVHVLQSDVDVNLYFYIGNRFAMKEGLYGYTKFDMGNYSPDDILNELKKYGWHVVSSGPARIIDSCFMNKNKDKSTYIFKDKEYFYDYETIKRKINAKTIDESIVAHIVMSSYNRGMYDERELDELCDLVKQKYNIDVKVTDKAKTKDNFEVLKQYHKVFHRKNPPKDGLLDHVMRELKIDGYDAKVVRVENYTKTDGGLRKRYFIGIKGEPRGLVYSEYVNDNYDVVETDVDIDYENRYTDIDTRKEVTKSLEKNYDKFKDSKKDKILKIEKIANDLYKFNKKMKDSLYNIGFVNRDDRSVYVNVEANSANEAKEKVKKLYKPYRIFKCTLLRK